MHRDKRQQDMVAFDLHLIGKHDNLGGIVEHDAHRLVTELVSEAVFVAVVHPLADPHERLRVRVGQLVRQDIRSAFQLYTDT